MPVAVKASKDGRSPHIRLQEVNVPENLKSASKSELLAILESIGADEWKDAPDNGAELDAMTGPELRKYIANSPTGWQDFFDYVKSGYINNATHLNYKTAIENCPDGIELEEFEPMVPVELADLYSKRRFELINLGGQSIPSYGLDNPVTMISFAELQDEMFYERDSETVAYQLEGFSQYLQARTDEEPFTDFQEFLSQCESMFALTEIADKPEMIKSRVAEIFKDFIGF